ncbi:RICIN domain-containing protein [Streptomyces sp. NPDC048718]|uniref:RICIN domain-containing protein n=1 Tax=Streptomyces sp. NPDC048718 TaxID=3365587 RepID=UPI0037190219
MAMALFIALALVPLTATAAKAASPFCLSGSFSYEFRSAEGGTDKPTVVNPVRTANVELWGIEKSGDQPRYLGGSGLTSYNGSYDLCSTNTTVTTMSSLWVTVWAENRRLWRVLDGAGQYVSMRSTTLNDIGPGFWGVSDTKATGAAGRGWHAFDTLNLAWWNRSNPTSDCWTTLEPDSNACTRLTINTAEGDSNAHYSPSSNAIYLTGDAADSEHTILHEAGHFLHHRLNNGVWPDINNCQEHYIQLASSETCAWAEGFADATAAQLLGDYRYVWGNGASRMLQYSEGWQVGDKVQGNVAASLRNLWRYTDGGWARTLAAMTAHRPTTFNQYFNAARPAANPPLPTTGEALSLLYRSAIDYGPGITGDGQWHGLTNGGGLGLRRVGVCTTATSVDVRIDHFSPANAGSLWKAEANADGTVRLSDNCPQSLALTAPAATGGTVTVKPFDPANAAQKWTIAKSNGTLRFTNPATGLVLDTPAIDPYTTAVAKTPSGANSQSWVPYSG